MMMFVSQRCGLLEGMVLSMAVGGTKERSTQFTCRKNLRRWLRRCWQPRSALTAWSLIEVLT